MVSLLAVLLCSHLISIYHHHRVVGAFHLAQAGVAKVLFPIGVCEIEYYCKNIRTIQIAL